MDCDRGRPAGEYHAPMRSTARLGTLLLLLLSFILASGLAGCAGLRLSPGELRVVTWNIRHGEGLDGRVDLERTMLVLDRLDADVLLLQEVDNGCARTGGVDQAGWLAERLELYAFFVPFMDYDGGEYGLAILTRNPPDDSSIIDLPPGTIEPRRAARVTVRSLDGRQLTLINAHLDWLEDDSVRFAQLEVLLEHAKDIEDPVIIAGDLNDVPGSRVIARLSETFTPIEPADGSAGSTFPANAPDRRIDWMAIHPAVAIRTSGTHVIDEPVASDHRPVAAFLVMR